MQEYHAHSYMHLLPPLWREGLLTLPTGCREQLEEIRIRAGMPLQIRVRANILHLHGSGRFTQDSSGLHCVTDAEVLHVLQVATQSSLYAVEEELRRGFLSVKGGHRIGVAGRVVLDEQGNVETLKDIRFLNIRIAREVPGAANKIKTFLVDPVRRRPLSTLLISPPGCGKTTLLRDLARQWSNGTVHAKIPGLNVAVVDERSELAGSYQGVPQLDVGLHTDVLDGCPKAHGMMMMIRSMSPDLVVTDEIGRAPDREAITEAIHSGVCILASAHGFGIQDVSKRPVLQELLMERAFKRYVVLSRRLGPCTVEGVWDENGRNLRKVCEEIPC